MTLVRGTRNLLAVAGLAGLLLLTGCGRCSTCCGLQPKPDEQETPATESGSCCTAAKKPDAEPVKPLGPGSCPMYGRTIARNLANPVEKGIADDWNVNPKKGALRNIKWAARLGTAAYGGPVIAGGRIFVSTNNDAPRDPDIKGDKGIVMCFRESDGKFLWQAVHDKLPDPDANDYPKQGVASTPVVDGNRLYYVSNRCELVCADVEGDQATGKAKFLWKLDMIKDLGVYPCQLANGSPLVIGDLVYTVTGNGANHETHVVTSPDAPSFIAVNKKTGKVVWKDSSPGKNIMEGQWTNPCAGEVNGKMQVIVPGGDGWLRGFEAKTGKLLWKFDCNPKKAVFQAGRPGRQELHHRHPGPARRQGLHRHRAEPRGRSRCRTSVVHRCQQDTRQQGP